MARSELRVAADRADDKVARGQGLVHEEALVLCDYLTEVETALHKLVKLKDGPRDEYYREEKDKAWDKAREVLDL